MTKHLKSSRAVDRPLLFSEARSQLYFLSFLGMVMYGNEFETKENKI